MKNKTQRRKDTARPAATKEFNHGFHGFHGLEMVSDQTTLIRVIRAIRGKIFTKRSDRDILQCKDARILLPSRLCVKSAIRNPQSAIP
jgi:hypothetical protein